MIRLMTENSANIEARMNLIRPMTANIENPKARNAIKIKSVGNTQKKDSSDSSSNSYDLSNKSDYRRKIRKNKKSHRENNTIKLCAKLTPKIPRTAYKSNIIKFKLDEDPLQRWIYFLIFLESLEMIVSQYKENCEAILDDPKIGGDNIKY